MKQRFMEKELNKEFNPQNQLDLNELKEAHDAIKQELGKVLIGQDNALDLLMTAFFGGGHVLVEGVPGIAKTLMSKLLAKSLSIGFSRIQFTPDLMPSDVIGTSVFKQKAEDFEFHRGPIFSNYVLIDEINRAPAKTQAALFEAMEERQVTVDGETHVLEEPFMVMATQNPVEQEGTYKLPEAQLDRFFFKIEMGYPSLDEETKLLESVHGRKNEEQLNYVNSVLNAERIKALQQQVLQLRIEPNLLRYIAEVVHKSRSHPSLYMGASPRASITILNASKAKAALSGRDYVTPDDIKEVICPAMRHRVILSPEREMEGINPDDVIAQLVQSVEVPR